MRCGEKNEDYEEERESRRSPRRRIRRIRWKWWSDRFRNEYARTDLGVQQVSGLVEKKTAELTENICEEEKIWEETRHDDGDMENTGEERSEAKVME